VIFSGTYPELIKNSSTETSLYLSGKKEIVRQNPKKISTKKFLSIYGAQENNLKNINVRFPLECMTVVTGVS
jgi:uvrA2